MKRLHHIARPNYRTSAIGAVREALTFSMTEVFLSSFSHSKQQPFCIWKGEPKGQPDWPQSCSHPIPALGGLAVMGGAAASSDSGKAPHLGPAKVCWYNSSK